MSLTSKYGSFKSITQGADKKVLDKDFWDKERKIIEHRVSKGREERKSMVMSNEKYYQTFSL